MSTEVIKSSMVGTDLIALDWATRMLLGRKSGGKALK